MKSDTLTITDLFQHFKSIYGTDPDPPSEQQLDHSLYESLENADLDSEISENELKNAVFAQKNNKSTGTDLLYAELFKSSFDILCPFLLNCTIDYSQMVNTHACGERGLLFRFLKVATRMRGIT